MFSTNYLFDLPQELQEIIYEKKHHHDMKVIFEKINTLPEFNIRRRLKFNLMTKYVEDGSLKMAVDWFEDDDITIQNVDIETIGDAIAKKNTCLDDDDDDLW